MSVSDREVTPMTPEERAREAARKLESTTCPQCNGTGATSSETDTCAVCGGEGYVPPTSEQIAAALLAFAAEAPHPVEIAREFGELLGAREERRRIRALQRQALRELDDAVSYIMYRTEKQDAAYAAIRAIDRATLAPRKARVRTFEQLTKAAGPLPTTGLASASPANVAVMCAHANEVPSRCRCAPGCYCKSHTCRSRKARVR